MNKTITRINDKMSEMLTFLDGTRFISSGSLINDVSTPSFPARIPFLGKEIAGEDEEIFWSWQLLNYAQPLNREEGKYHSTSHFTS